VSSAVDEQPALFQAGGRVGPRVREPDRAFSRRGRRIAVHQRGAQKILKDGEPIAPVAVGADQAPFVLLPSAWSLPPNFFQAPALRRRMIDGEFSRDETVNRRRGAANDHCQRESIHTKIVKNCDRILLAAGKGP